MISKWQKSILKECRRRLGRDLTSAETQFVTSRGGFIALEMIDETVKSLEGAALAEYLNSESQDN